MKHKTFVAISIVSLLASLLFAEGFGCTAVSARRSESRGHTNSWPCCGATTERIVIQPDQIARLALKNEGEKSLAARLQFVDKEGKVIIQRDATINPGDIGALEYGGFGGGVQPVELRAQFGTEDAKFIGLLRPTLHVVDKESGKTVRLIGPEGFKESKLIPGPH